MLGANSAKCFRELTHTHVCFILTPKVLKAQRCKSNNRPMIRHGVSTEGSVRGTIEVFNSLELAKCIMWSIKMAIFIS